MTDSRPSSPQAEVAHQAHEATEDKVEAPTDTATEHETAQDSAEASVDHAALVEELRASLATAQATIATQTTKLSSLTDTETELAALKDQFKFVSAAKEAVEKQLKEEIKRREVAEENVELLRGQVEQARRGVGLLHKQEQERKRMSLLPPAVPIPVEEVSEEDGAAVKAAKRASIILGRNPRRTSGQEGDWPGTPGSQVASSPAGLGPPPRAGGLRELRLGSGGMYSSPGGVNSPTTGALVEEDNGETSQRPAFVRSSSSTGGPSSTHSSPKKTQEDKLRAELAATRAKLADAEEARDASETCLKALREFMAGGGEGADPPEDLLKGIRLPPLPTDRDPDDIAQEEDTSAKKGWGFKLWRQGPASAISPPASTVVEPSATPADTLSVAPSVTSGTNPKTSPLVTPGELPTESTVGSIPSSSTPLASFVSGWTKSVAPGTPADKPATASRSISSFFSRKKEETPGVDQDKDLPEAPELTQEASALSQETAVSVAEEAAEVKDAAVSPTGGLSDVPLDEPAEGAEAKGDARD